MGDTMSDKVPYCLTRTGRFGSRIGAELRLAGECDGRRFGSDRRRSRGDDSRRGFGGGPAIVAGSDARGGAERNVQILVRNRLANTGALEGRGEERWKM